MAGGSQSTEDGGQVVVGLLADPGVPAEIAQCLSVSLPRALSRRVDDRVRWEVAVAREELTVDEYDRIPMVDSASAAQAAEGWDYVVCLTDLPRRAGGKTVVADASTAHGVALVSVPALGWVRLQARARNTIVHLVGVMAAGLSGHGGHRRRRLGRAGALVSPIRPVLAGGEDIDVHLALTGARGQVRLLTGMVRDNRPWRLVPSLSKAIAAAIATAAFGIFYSSIWSMADALSPLRLAMASLFSMGIMVTWLIVHNALWEPRERGDRKERLRYNLSTVLTLACGVLCMYLILFAVTLLGATVVISAEYLRKQLGHPVGYGDYATLTWLASSMGTVAGALGSSLETEEAVRQATYSKREQQRRAHARAREEEKSQPETPS